MSRSNGKPTGTIPTGATLKRTTLNTYYTPAGTSSDAYHQASSWQRTGTTHTGIKRDSLHVAKIQVTSGSPLSQRRLTYDNAVTTGNVTRQESWDSVTQAWLPILHTYDSHGNHTSTTDANGTKTTFAYGSISYQKNSLTQTVSNLYLTQRVEAVHDASATTETSVARTIGYDYDFWTGAVLETTDRDNSVKTDVTVDGIGRPTLVKEAFGVSAVERHTETEYCDADRRIMVRADVASQGGGEMVTVTDYDPLGRVRGTRRYESEPDADADCDGDDAGASSLQTQTRYQFSGANSYGLSSNPYRAAASSGAGTESTMGWTRSKQDQLGRVLEVESFQGAALPSPWGSNTTSTGKTVSAYDAEYTTVTDAAGKLRRSRVEGLGRLVQVDEPNSAGALGTTAAPHQKTVYAYDALSNLTSVTQGTQTRSFTYSSLSRLTSADNPESGELDYGYDKNGNLTGKVDDRSVTVTYEYDKLNRLTKRTYSGGPAEAQSTEQVNLSYDDCGSYSKGRLCGVESLDTDLAEFSSTHYTSYDALGRVLESSQRTDGKTYLVSYGYDRAGNLTSQAYPSGKTIETEYDDAGRVVGVKEQGGSYYAGGSAASDHIEYAAHGARQQIKLGNGLYQERRFNSRLQPTQIGLGQTSTGLTTALGTTHSNRLLLDYCFSGTNHNCDNATSSNNGNLLGQRIRVGTSLDLRQSYTYDSLNRLSSAGESSGQTGVWSQSYSYDRFGNRAVTGAASYRPHATLTPQALTSFDTATNRLTGGTVAVSYDSGGNLTTDWGGRDLPVRWETTGW